MIVLIRIPSTNLGRSHNHRLALVGEGTLNEDAAFRSDSDAFGLPVVIGAADGLVSCWTLVQTGLDRLACVDIEM